MGEDKEEVGETVTGRNRLSHLFVGETGEVLAQWLEMIQKVELLIYV